MPALDEILRQLEATGGDVRAQAAITAEFAIALQPATRRDRFRAALDAAAVLRAFDAELLGRLLGCADTDTREAFAALSILPFVERYPSRAEDWRNLHEATRLGWRRRLFLEHPSRFRDLSARAAEFFASNETPFGRTEWIYHLLSADPERGATALQELDLAWSGAAHPEDRQALALTLAELEATGLIAGRARLEVLLCVAEARAARGVTARLEENIAHVQQMAHELDRGYSLARAYSLQSSLEETRGNPKGAIEAIERMLEISRRLAGEEPANIHRQRDLAVSLGRTADLLQNRGANERALAMARESLVLSQQVADSNTANTLWQLDLAVGHGRLATALRSLDDLNGAQASLEDGIAICRSLLQRDSENAGWLRELAVLVAKLGDVLQASDKFEAARDSFAEDLRISQRLAEADPTNAFWLRDLSITYQRVGGLQMVQKDFAEARRSFEKSLALDRRLVEADPRNAAAQRDLAIAQSNLGATLKALGELDAARTAYEENLAICRRLAESDPENAQAQHDLAVALVLVSRMETSPDNKRRKIEQLREAERVLDALTSSPEWQPPWQEEHKIVAEELQAAEAP